eukprot:2087601-Amphidinium_carterae.1
MVGLCKSSVRKLVGASSSIDHSLWPYACLWTGELIHAAIGIKWPYPAFAELVAIKKTQVKSKKITPRGALAGSFGLMLGETRLCISWIKMVTRS